MLNQIQKILKENNILSHRNTGITIATVENMQKGFLLAENIFTRLVDTKTVLYLSGGSTPKELYKRFATAEQITPGAVGMVDERYGEKFHEKSNETMIRETGFFRYLQMRDIPFYPILQGKKREATAQVYDQQVRSLHATFQKSIALLGIGLDGHTASLAPNRTDFQNPMFSDAQKHLFVSEFADLNSFYGERVGMTFLGLSMLDFFVVLAFGSEKQNVITLLFENGPEEQLPARFFKRPDIAPKTILITDQKI